MQDMIISSVYLTMRDTFLTKEQYHQLLYVGVFNENTHERIHYMKPAILKPKQLWTGKQLISTIMKIIVGYEGGLNMEHKTKISK